MAFYQFPGSNFHDLNLDWLLQEMKNCLAEWEATKQEWTSTEESWSNLQQFVTNYFENLDISQEISDKINQMLADGTLLQLLTGPAQASASTAATTWIQNNLSQQAGYAVDTSLSIAGAAADSRASGALSAVLNSSYFVQGGYKIDTGNYATTARIRTKTAFHCPVGYTIKWNLPEGYSINVFELATSDMGTDNNTLQARAGRANTGEYITAHNAWVVITIGKTNEGNIVPADFVDGSIVVGNLATNTVLSHLTQRTITHMDFAPGGYTTADGAYATTTRVRLYSPVYVRAGSKITFNCDPFMVLMWILPTDSITQANVAVSVINKTATQHIYMPADGYVMIALCKSASTEDITVEEIRDVSIVIDESIDEGIATEAEYYNHAVTLNEFAQVQADAQKVQNADECFVFFTDYHTGTDSGNGCSFYIWTATQMKKLSGAFPVSFVLSGGDVFQRSTSVTKTSATRSLVQFTNVFNDVFPGRFYQLYGNHDNNYYTTAAGNTLTRETVNAIMFANTGSPYYKIVRPNSVTYTFDSEQNRVGNNYNVPMNAYKWQQLDWFARDLAANNPQHVIMAMHTILNNNTGTPEFMFFTELHSVAVAFNNHTTITKNGITYDFTSCTGRVEFILGGHIHSSDYDFIKDGICCIIRATAMVETDKLLNEPKFDVMICEWTTRHLKIYGYGGFNSVDIDLATGEHTPIE